nr:hypothetical protein BaRGS_019688 [Batillaria attramentaria]
MNGATTEFLHSPHKPDTTQATAAQISTSDCCNFYGNFTVAEAYSADPTHQPASLPFGNGLLNENDYLRLTHAVQIATAPILLVGIVTNAVSILVYARMPGGVTSTYFSLTSGLDIVYLVSVLPTTFMSVVLGNKMASRSVFFMNYVLYVSDYFSSTTRKVIVCVTMLMSLDRVRSLHHFRRPWLYTGIVIILAYLFDMNRNFKNKVIVGTDQTNPVQMVPTRIFLENRQLFLDLALASSIVFQYTPLVLLVLFNVLLVAALAEHSRKMKTRFGGEKNGENSSSNPFPGEIQQNVEDNGEHGLETYQRNFNNVVGGGKHTTKVPKLRREKSVTRTVLVYSLTFIMLAAPYTFFPLLRRLVPGFEVFDREHYLVMSFGLVFVLLDTVSSAMNFFIYFATGSAFRAGVLRLSSITMKRNKQTSSFGQNTRTSNII